MPFEINVCSCQLSNQLFNSFNPSEDILTKGKVSDVYIRFKSINICPKIVQEGMSEEA